MKEQKERTKRTTSEIEGIKAGHLTPPILFLLGFGLCAISTMITLSGFLAYDQLFVIFRAALAWTGLFFILRAIYLAIKKKVKK